MSIVFKARLKEVGNFYFLPIPKYIVEKFKIKAGQKVLIGIRGNYITIFI